MVKATIRRNRIPRRPAFKTLRSWRRSQARCRKSSRKMSRTRLRTKIRNNVSHNVATISVITLQLA